MHRAFICFGYAGRFDFETQEGGAFQLNFEVRAHFGTNPFLWQTIIFKIVFYIKLVQLSSICDRELSGWLYKNYSLFLSPKMYFGKWLIHYLLLASMMVTDDCHGFKGGYWLFLLRLLAVWKDFASFTKARQRASTTTSRTQRERLDSSKRWKS